MASMDFSPPKYARVVTGIIEKIDSGQYAPGDMLPSETQLVREYGVGRTTVVRALSILASQGWIEREHGRGSFVKGRPLAAGERIRPAQTALDETEIGEQLGAIGRQGVPAHVAAMMEVPQGTPAVLRQRVLRHGDKPAGLVSLWFPLEIAIGTDLDKPEPLVAGVRQHLQQIQRVRFDHITERLTARHPTKEEAERLGLTKSAAVIGILATIYNPAKTVLAVADIALPGDLHELEDTYPVT